MTREELSDRHLAPILWMVTPTSPLTLLLCVFSSLFSSPVEAKLVVHQGVRGHQEGVELLVLHVPRVVAVPGVNDRHTKACAQGTCVRGGGEREGDGGEMKGRRAGGGRRTTP